MSVLTEAKDALDAAMKKLEEAQQNSPSKYEDIIKLENAMVSAQDRLKRLKEDDDTMEAMAKKRQIEPNNDYESEKE